MWGTVTQWLGYSAHDPWATHFISYRSTLGKMSTTRIAEFHFVSHWISLRTMLLVRMYFECSATCILISVAVNFQSSKHSIGWHGFHVIGLEYFQGKTTTRSHRPQYITLYNWKIKSKVDHSVIKNINQWYLSMS